MIKHFRQRCALYAATVCTVAMVSLAGLGLARGPLRSAILARSGSALAEMRAHARSLMEELGTFGIDLEDGVAGDDPIDALTHSVTAALVASNAYHRFLAQGWEEDAAFVTAYHGTYALGLANELLQTVVSPKPEESNMDLWNNREGLSVFIALRDEEHAAPFPSAEDRERRAMELAVERLQNASLIRDAYTDGRQYRDWATALASHAGGMIAGGFAAAVLACESLARRKGRS